MRELKRIIAKGFSNPLKFYKAPKLIYNALVNVKYQDITVEELNDINKNSLIAIRDLIDVKPSISKRSVKDIKKHKCEDELQILFNKYGSDKASMHGYQRLYYRLFNSVLRQPSNIFEIGLGTNNIDVKSNMGIDGKPGASLRTFRDYLPNSNIFGADIDERVLFSEDRIETFYVDQTDPATFIGLAESLKGIKFDLMIDDGLHNSWANLNSLSFFLEHISENGVMLIEDIKESDLIYYEILSQVRKDLDFIWMKFNVLNSLIISGKAVDIDKIFE